MAQRVSPLWRWLITDLCGVGITTLDELAAERTVTPKLNEPLEMTCTVPSDNNQVNRLHTDDFPFVHEGVRELYGFRKEWDSVAQEYVFTIRASTLILQVDDAAAQDDARSRITAWDAWQYLFYLPVYVVVGETSQLVPRDGYTYEAGVRADEIALSILTQAYVNLSLNFPNCGTPGSGGPLDLFVDFGQTAFWTGTVEACRIPAGFRVEQGATVGQALQDLCSAGFCDIVFDPIYDPVNRPGILNQLSIYAQDPADSDSGAGIRNWSARFAWDRPGRSLVGADDLFDGTQRANRVLFSRGTAGKTAPLQEDVPSETTYGDYWAMQAWPQQKYDLVTVTGIAAEQLYLRKVGKQTLTVNPAPERAPEPWVDYNIGDRVPVFVSDNMRYPLPPYWPGPPAQGDSTLVWQRVYGIPVDIDDNGTETVTELLVGPVGPPPPAPGAAAGAGGDASAAGGSSPGVGLTPAVAGSGGSRAGRAGRLSTYLTRLPRGAK